MNFKGARIIYIFVALAGFVFLVNSLMHFQAKRLLGFVRHINRWIYKQAIVIKFLVYFATLTPMQLLCLPGMTVFIISACFYLKDFPTAWILFQGV